RLTQCVASGGRVWVEPSGGVEIPLMAMLRGAGITSTQRLGPDEVPAAEDVVLRPGQAPGGGLPLRLFKALQLVHTRNLKADFDDFVAFDIETSDFDFESSQIIDIAAVRVRDNVVVDRFQSLVSCARPI